MQSQRIDCYVGAMAANVMTAAAAASDLTTELQTGLATSAALTTAQTDLDDIQTRIPAALVSGRIDASVGAVAANAITATSIATDAITAAKIEANAIGASELATDAVTEIVTAVLTTAMTEAYAADNVAPTLAQCLFLIMQSLHEFAISGTTRTVKKLDGSTSAATFTLDSATAPTSTTRAT